MTDSTWTEPQPDGTNSETTPAVAATDVSPINQPEPVEQPEPAEPLPVADENAQPETFDGPGLSPAAHNPSLATDDTGTLTTLSGSTPEQPNVEQPAPTPPPANTPGSELTGIVDNLNVPDDGVVTCPICQARFVPGKENVATY